jgi:hypothetical protein
MIRTKFNGNGRRNGNQKKLGRPSRYKEDMPQRAYKLCLLGLRDQDLAVAFGVGIGSIDVWKKEHPEFFEAIKRGRDEADAHVAESLYHRALGYSHPEEVIKVVGGQVVRLETMKHYPPDTGAACFWLKNRHRDRWRDVHRYEHTGKDGEPIQSRQVTLDLSTLTDEELEMAMRIGLVGSRDQKTITIGAEDVDEQSAAAGVHQD